jgi:MSHA biogenesis protein MshN
MSLVNDMLRDLASQQSQHSQQQHSRQTTQHAGPASQDDNETLLQDSSLLQNKRASWMPSIAVFIITVGALLVIQQIFFPTELPSAVPVQTAAIKTDDENFNRDDNSNHNVQGAIHQGEIDPAVSSPVYINEQESPTAKTQVAVIHESQADAAVKNPAPASFVKAMSNQTTLNQTTLDQTNQDQTNQQQIFALIQRAERALTLDRLTAPVEDNAYTHFRAILTLAPDNSLAHEGLQRIAQRYIELAQVAATQHNMERAQTLLQRAEWVAPDYAPIADAREQMSGAPLLATIPDAPAAQPGTAVAPVLADATKTSSDLVSTESVAVKTLAVTGAGGGDFEIKTNPGWQDQQAVAQAELLVSQGQDQAAQLFLEQFVTEHQQPVKAAHFLFNQYVRTLQYDAARLLLQRAQAYLSAVDQTRMTAQLLVAQGNHSAAVSALEKNVEQAEQDESYRALLAGLYHKTARYQESANSYRRMLDVFGEKPAYWLGLALALDALQQRSSALEAYRRIGLNGAQPQVKDYVEQRIAALSNR